MYLKGEGDRLEKTCKEYIGKRGRRGTSVEFVNLSNS